MSANLEEKKKVVSEIINNVKSANLVAFVDCCGVTVDEDTRLRKSLRESNVKYKVYKNRLMLKALQELDVKNLDEKMFEGPTAVLFGEDEVAPAKIFNDASQDYKKMSFKFGILNGEVISKDKLLELAKLPSKETLIAMLLGMLQAPMSAFARALNAIAEQK